MLMSTSRDKLLIACSVSRAGGIRMGWPVVPCVAHVHPCMSSPLTRVRTFRSWHRRRWRQQRCWSLCGQLQGTRATLSFGLQVTNLCRRAYLWLQYHSIRIASFMARCIFVGASKNAVGTTVVFFA